MDASVKLGRIWGVPVGLHWSWFLIFGMVTISLAEGFFPDNYPAMPTGAHWALGAVTSVLFFVSVLLHELGHVRIAQRNGIPVRQVTLFLFGGVAQIGREARSAGAEFRIAIAGPLVSLALAAAFGAFYLIDREVSSYLAAPSGWLAAINLMLALFNMIPGYPLDGGRVFKAAVWRVTGDENRAGRWAAISGQIVAAAFIGFGALRIVWGDVGGGIWLMFIGWFLQNAAAATWGQNTMQRTLGGVTVAQVMSTAVTTIPGRAPLRDVVEHEILRSGRRLFFVDTDGRPDDPEGMLTLGEVTKVPREQWNRVTAQDAMTPWDRLVCVRPDSGLLQALEQMDTAGVGQVPVVDDGHALGILTREDVLRYIRTRSELRM